MDTISEPGDLTILSGAQLMRHQNTPWFPLTRDLRRNGLFANVE